MARASKAGRNGTFKRVEIGDIHVGRRCRKDMGDLAELCESMVAVGQLQPVVVTADLKLIAGERRIRAAKAEGWKKIDVMIAAGLEGALEQMRAEADENVCRKGWAPSEAVAMAARLEPLATKDARERQGGKGRKRSAKLAERSKGDARDSVSEAVGMKRTTLEKARAVVSAAKADPKVYGDLVEKMDRTGKVDPGFKEMKKRKKKTKKAATPKGLPNRARRWKLYCGDFRKEVEKIKAGSVDWVICDPPYPKQYLELYDGLSEASARVLKKGGSLLVMVGQSYLPFIYTALSKHLTYTWTLAYLTPGGQSAQIWKRKVNTFWKPVLWFTKGEYKGDWVGDVAKSDVNDNDKRFHGWGQSESGMADIVERLTYPGETILDPFLGGGTTGLVAVNLKRKFIGIDIDKACVEAADKRIGNNGSQK